MGLWAAINKANDEKKDRQRVSITGLKDLWRFIIEKGPKKVPKAPNNRDEWRESKEKDWWMVCQIIEANVNW